MPQTVNIPFIGQMNFPDNMSSADMKSAIDEKYPQAQQLAQHADMIKQNINNLGTFNQRQNDSFGENLGAGFINGMMRTGAGWNQALSSLYEKMGMVPRGTEQQLTNEENQRQQEFNQGGNPQTWGGAIGNFAGQAAPFAALPIAGEGRIAQGLSGAVGGGIAGGTSFLPNLQNEAEQRRGNTEIGAATGAILPQIPPMLMSGISRVSNAMRGIPESPEVGALRNYADQNNLPLFAQDVSSNPAVQTMGKRLEDVPSGMTTAREAQNEAVGQFAKGMPQQFRDAMDATQYGNLSDIQTVAQSGGVRAQKAQTLLQQINNTQDDDWRQILMNSRDATGFGKQLQADAKYNTVEQLAQKAGTFVPTQTVAALNDTIKEMSTRVMPDNPAFQQLQLIQKKLSPEPQIALPEGTPAPPSSVGAPTTFTDMRNLRSDLGQIIKTYYTGNNAMIGEAGVQNLQKIKNAVSNDMNGFAEQNGGALQKAWKDADSYYLNEVVPYKNKQLANSANPDGIYGSFIKNGFETGKPEQLFNGLDEKGQAAVRYGMVDNAFKKAYDEQMDKFSPAVFNSTLQKQIGARDTFFSGNAKTQLDGFLNYLAHMKGAANAIGEKKAATGIRAVPFLVYGELEHMAAREPVSAAATVAGMQGLRMLFTTKWGRNFLTSASTTRPGSPMMQRLIDQTTKTMIANTPSMVNGGGNVPIQQQQ